MANRNVAAGGTGDSSLDITQLPATAIQAIYHAVTGKTENLSKYFHGNVKINSGDISRLHQMIIDQVGHYELEADPTVTVVVKTDDRKAYTYSSWERYAILATSNYEVTSSILLKYEFLVKLPNGGGLQRCVISIELDSALPVLLRSRKNKTEMDELSFFMFMASEWRTVDVSIDFVDYLIAKIFCSVVDDWFKSIDKIKLSRLNSILFHRQSFIRSIFNQSGRIGMASFFAALFVFSSVVDFSLKFVVLASSVGLFIWSFLAAIGSLLAGRFIRRISSNIIPSVIIKSDADVKSFKEIEDDANSGSLTIIGIIFMILINISLNIIASIIYAKIFT